MSTTNSDVLRLARESFEARAWKDAMIRFAAADSDSPMEVEDLERWAVAACLAGEVKQAAAAWTRAHRLCADDGDFPRAVMNAFWVAFGLIQAGEFAAAGGWVDRAQRMLDESAGDCVEQGYLRFLAGLRAIFEGDAAAAHSAFTIAGKIGQRFHDPELTTFARAGQGRCLIYLGEPAEGVALIDEALVAVTSGELSPIAAGNSYCVAIEGCQEVFDFRRAQAWTRALSDWCDDQPQMVLYRAVCLVRRAEIMVLHGDWEDAREALQLAQLQMKQWPVRRAMGPAFYLEGEIHRLTGDTVRAEDAYRRANEWGREPQPGLALLRMQQGRLDAALASIRRVLSEARGPVERGRALEPSVEISLAAGDVDAARSSIEELSDFADERQSPFLQALSHYARGTWLLAGGDARTAITELRPAWRLWNELEVPYEQARTRVQLALTFRTVGDEDGATMELDAARSGFQALGAVPDLARVVKLSHPEGSEPATGLTPREVEVLRLLATGKTNRAIASALVVSEKTVATHVGHIFTKLGLESRSAATAYAYENRLVQTSQ